jgi:hypothetical protein
MNVEYLPTDAYIATPSDTATQFGKGFIFTGGACSVVTDARPGSNSLDSGGNTVVIPAAFAGIVIPLRIRGVNATGTTATSVLVLR